MDEETDKQKTKQNGGGLESRPWLAPYVFKKGVSGNPKGRPKGQTLKEWARERIMEMDDDDRIEFLKRIPAEMIWRLAEGNPHNTENVTHTLAPTPILSLDKVDVPPSVLPSPQTAPEIGPASPPTGGGAQ